MTWYSVILKNAKSGFILNVWAWHQQLIAYSGCAANAEISSRFIHVYHFNVLLNIFRTYMLLLRFNMDPSRYRLAHPSVGRIYIKPFQQYVYLRLLWRFHMNLSRYRLAHPGVGKVLINPVLVNSCIYMLLLRFNMDPSRYRLAHPSVGRVYIKPFQQYVYLRLLWRFHMNLSRYRLAHPGVGKVLINPVLVNSCIYMLLLRFNMDPSRYRLAHPSVGRVYIKPFQQCVYLR